MTRRTFLLAAAGAAALGAAFGPLLSASAVGIGERTFAIPPNPTSAGTDSLIPPNLTPVEADIFKLLVDGRNGKQISKKLGMPRDEVHAHVVTVTEKLNTHIRLAQATPPF